MTPRLLFACLLGAALAGCGSTAAPAPSSPRASAATGSSAATSPASSGVTKVNVAYSQIIPPYLPLWVAQDGGIYARNGLDVTQQMLTSTTGMASLLSGEVVLNVGGGPELLNATANGADVVGLANLTPVSAFKFEVAASIKSKADLVGKKIGITRFGSNTDISVRAMLKQEGLDPDKDVSFVQLDNSTAIAAALVAGSVQAALAVPPDTLKLEAAGLHPLFDLGQLKIPGTDAVVQASRPWLGAHRDIAQRYVDSLIQSMARMRQDKPFAIATLKKYLKLDDETALNSAYDYFVGTVFPPLPYAQPEQFVNVLAAINTQSGKLQGYDVSKVLDNSLVKSAGDRGLDK
jgi:ABC-type nitrate/sulfonate/bicarbonate transport system substrate-binding protein